MYLAEGLGPIVRGHDQARGAVIFQELTFWQMEQSYVRSSAHFPAPTRDRTPYTSENMKIEQQDHHLPPLLRSLVASGPHPLDPLRGDELVLLHQHDEATEVLSFRRPLDLEEPSEELDGRQRATPSERAAKSPSESTKPSRLSMSISSNLTKKPSC